MPQDLRSGLSERKVTFLLAWHFPDFGSWTTPRKNAPPSHRVPLRGLVFDAAAALTYGAASRVMLRDARRRSWSFYQTTLPCWLLEAVAAAAYYADKVLRWDGRAVLASGKGLGCCRAADHRYHVLWQFPISRCSSPRFSKSQMRLTRAISISRAKFRT